MFTMKKFATLAVAGFLAASMVGCPDDGTDEEDGSSSSTPSSSSSSGVSSPGVNWVLTDITSASWTKKVTITIGGQNNNSLGSFLDLDLALSSNGAQGIYKKGTVESHKDEIDLIFDGTNIFTPGVCLEASGVCHEAEFNTVMVGYKGQQDPDDLKFYMSELVRSERILSTTSKEDAGKVYGDEATKPIFNTVVKAKPEGIYYVVTTLGYGVLILVGGGNYGASSTGETTLTLLAS